VLVHAKVAPCCYGVMAGFQGCLGVSKVLLGGCLGVLDGFWGAARLLSWCCWILGCC